jgi:hypothetical protein
MISLLTGARLPSFLIQHDRHQRRNAGFGSSRQAAAGGLPLLPAFTPP